jgi:hypothetical protein
MEMFSPWVTRFAKISISHVGKSSLSQYKIHSLLSFCRYDGSVSHKNHSEICFCLKCSFGARKKTRRIFCKVISIFIIFSWKLLFSQMNISLQVLFTKKTKYSKLCSSACDIFTWIHKNDIIFIYIVSFARDYTRKDTQSNLMALSCLMKWDETRF